MGKKDLREKIRKEKRQKEEYKRKWENKEQKSLIHLLKVKVNLEQKNEIFKFCDKKGLSISGGIRALILRGLNKGGQK